MQTTSSALAFPLASKSRAAASSQASELGFAKTRKRPAAGAQGSHEALSALERRTSAIHPKAPEVGFKFFPSTFLAYSAALARNGSNASALRTRRQAASYRTPRVVRGV